jgi:hypothetical protein
MRFEVVQPKADVPTENGRIYPRPVLEKAIERVAEQVKSGRFLGYVGQQEWEANLADAAFVIRELTLTPEGIIQGDMDILGTEKGGILSALLGGWDMTGSVGYYTAGIGTVDESNVIQDDFQLEFIFADKQDIK